MNGEEDDWNDQDVDMGSSNTNAIGGVIMERKTEEVEIDNSKNDGNGDDNEQIVDDSLEDMPGTQDNEADGGDEDWSARRQKRVEMMSIKRLSLEENVEKGKKSDQ